MLLSIPIIFKILLFMNITEIRHNQLLIFMFTISISLLVLSLFEFFDTSKKKYFQLGFYTVFSILLFGDVLYYSYFHALPSFAIVGQARQLGAVTDSIRDLVGIKNLLFVLDIPIIIIVFIRGLGIKVNKIVIKKIIVSTVLLIALLTTYSFSTSRVSALTNQEPFAFHTYDIIKNLFLKGSTRQYINLEELLKDIVKSNDELYPQDRRLKGIGEGRNLIVIQVEALQNFVVDYYHNDQEVTPFINSLIKHNSSIYFDEYYQLIGRGNTSDAEFVTNNSMHPSMEDATYIQYSDNTFYGLPWLLRDNGYDAYVFHGFKKDFWNRYNAYDSQGFERFYHEEDYDFEEEILFGISDREFYSQTLDYLVDINSESDNPFYSFIISLSSHTPYNMAEEYHILELSEKFQNNIVGNYLHAIHYADNQLGLFIEGLKRVGLYENSIIAIYGDHFGINNSFEEAFDPMEEILGEKYNFDHIMNIPLIIHVPGEDINQTVSTIGSQIDFYPTIINILGLENEKGIMFGKDLINYSGYNFVAPQTIMRKGSFIDSNVVFNISRDGIFENSTVISRKNREFLDIEEYREEYENVLAHINASDIVLKNDLLVEIIQRNGDFSDYNISLNNIVPEQSRIQSFEEYNFEDIQKSYNNGNYINRITIDEATDLDEMAKWMKENEMAFLILRTSDGSNKLLETIKDNYPSLRDRYIAEINDFDDLFLIQRRGFRNIILNITKSNYSGEQIRDFLNLYDHFGLIIKDDGSAQSLFELIDQPNIRFYKEVQNRILQIR